MQVFSTDGLKHYFYALTAHFGRWEKGEGKKPAWVLLGEFLYGQVIKHQRRRRTVEVERRLLCGEEEQYQERLRGAGLSGKINTAFVERLNLTIRQCVSKLTRRTWGPARFSLELMDHFRWWRRHRNGGAIITFFTRRWNWGGLADSPARAGIRPGATVENLPGSYLGPIIRIQSGKKIRFVFHNNLPEESVIHPHGLRVPENCDGQPMQAIGPGESLTYEFPVIDPACPAWFHPHPMMRTAYQVAMGLAGLFYVTDPQEEAAVPGAGTGANDLPVVILLFRTGHSTATTRSFKVPTICKATWATASW